MELLTSVSIYKTNATTYRYENLNGKVHVVAPVVAIVPGVLNGELVPLAEIAQGFASWNGRPVTLDHPNVDGSYVTANDPTIWEQFVIGQLFNVDFNNDRLKGEIWIDVAAAKTTLEGQQLLDRLAEGKQIEVSTAYFRELDPVSGIWEGEPYEGVAKDLKPDHLAILLHTAGACSWADGCGVPRLNQREVNADMPSKNEDKLMDQDQAKLEVHTEGGAEPIQDQGKVFYSWWEKFKEGVRATLLGNQNEQSLEEQWDAVVSAFYRLIESGQPVGEVGDGYVTQVFDSHIIVERVDGAMFQIEYAISEEGTVEFGAQQEGRMAFVPVNNEDSTPVETNSETEIQAEEPTEAEPDSEEPAANEDVEDEEPESEMEPEPNNLEEDAEVDSEEAEDEDEADPEDEEPAVNESRCQEYVALVEFADSYGGPEWALNQLQAALAIAAEQRQTLIESLAANQACAFTAADLGAWETDALRKLQKTLEAPRANFAGQPNPAKPEQQSQTQGKTRINLPPL